MPIEVENPYNESAEFKIKILESSKKNGTIKNPYSLKNASDDSISTSDPNQPSILAASDGNNNTLKDASKTSVETKQSLKLSKSFNNLYEISLKFLFKATFIFNKMIFF